MFKQFFSGSDFLKNVLTLMTGATVAQLIPILISPIITRIYTPEDIGLFGLFFSVAAILSVVATLRYELAIMLPEEDRDSANLVALSTIINFFIALILLLIIAIFRTQIADLLNNDRIADWLYLVPLSVFLIGMYQCINYWLLRKKAFKASAINRISQKAGEGTTNLGFGFAHFGGGLILGELVGRFSMNLVGLFQMRRTKFPLDEIDRAGIQYVKQRYKEFPLSNAIPALINSSSMHLPLLFISNFFTEAMVGFFNLTRQILSAPIALISRNVSQVLLERLADRKNKGLPVYNYLIKVAGLLAGIAIAFTVVLLLFGPQLFSFIFGAEWRFAGEYAQILVIGFGIKFIVSPLSIVFTALEKIKYSSAWQVFYFVLILTLLLAVYFDAGIKQFLILYTIVDVVAYSVYFFMIVYVTREYDRSLSTI